MGATKTYIAWPWYGSLSIGLRVDYGQREAINSLDSDNSILIKSHGMPWDVGLSLRATHGVTHFAMVHADILPQEGWLDALHDEMERTGVDVISALMPKKNDSGETSTAVERLEDGKLKRRLITMREAATLPETFTADDLHPGSWLLVNTGLWLAKLDGPWCEQVSFQHVQWIDRRQVPAVFDHETEDWYMSRILHQQGVKVACTRKVAAGHRGTFDYPNQGAWGRIERHDWTDSHSIVPGLDPNYHPPGVIA